MTDLRTAAKALLKTWDHSFKLPADLEDDVEALRAALAEARQPVGDLPDFYAMRGRVLSAGSLVDKLKQVQCCDPVLDDLFAACARALSEREEERQPAGLEKPHG